MYTLVNWCVLTGDVSWHAQVCCVWDHTFFVELAHCAIILLGPGILVLRRWRNTGGGEQTDPGVQGQAQHCQVCSSHVNPHAIHMGAWA